MKLSTYQQGKPLAESIEATKTGRTRKIVTTMYVTEKKGKDYLLEHKYS
jgi:hypothetical protein